MKFKLTVFCFFSVLFLQSRAQLGTLKGRITDGNIPLEFVVVGIENSSFSTLTDREGRYKIDKIPFGEYKVIVSSFGYSQVFSGLKLTDTEQTIDFNLFAQSSSLNEVVITGTMQEITRSDSPIPVEILNPKLFLKNPSPSLFESMQMVNGVQPQLNCNVCNTGDIHINGMEGPYTMITIDGMPIVSSLSTVYGLSGIPNSMVNRIEVVKGPASTLYGSEAVGGLINVITKDPLSAPVFSADAMVTSDEELNLDLGFRLKRNRISSLTGINYFNFQNRMDRNNDNFTDLTLQHRISVFNKWRIERKENRISTVAARFVYEDRWGGEMQWESKYRGGDSIYGESIFTTRYELIGLYELPMKEKFFLQYSFNNHNQNSWYGTVPFMAEQTVAFAQLYWRSGFSEKLNLLAGLPLRYTFYDDNTAGTGGLDSSGISNYPQKTFLPGVFVQAEYTYKKLLTLAGLRYDYNSDHGSILSPRLAFRFRPNNNHSFRLSSGNGYRVVNLFTEDHAALSGAREVVIKESLKPERSWNVNLNHLYTFSRKRSVINVESAIFYTYFSNKIVGDFLSDPGKIIFDNLKGYAVSQGIALNLDFLFSNGVKLIMGGTYMEVYSMEADSSGILQKIPQLHAPSFSGNFSLSYTFGGTGVSVDYTGNIKSPMYLPVVPNDYRPEKSPWFSIHNFQLTKKFRKGLEVYAGIKNIFDFRPADPILRPFDPFDKNISENNPEGYTFDPSYNYSSLQGRRFFIGIRYNLFGK